MTGLLLCGLVIAREIVSGGGASAEFGVEGGTLRSHDYSVSVTFAPGEVDAGTAVHLRTEEEAAPPPAAVRPLRRPFAITATSGRARTGLVTVRVGEMPSGIPVSRMVMAVYDEPGRSWKILPTMFDPGSATASARWPYFSSGFIGFVDPLFRPEGWRWENVGDGGFPAS
jgi:hypothetical protein